MSVHKIDISKDWKLAYLKKQTKARWYRYFGDWKIEENRLIGSKYGNWFQAIAWPYCAPVSDYDFSCKLTLVKDTIARINLNFEPSRLTKYTVEFREGECLKVFYVFQELFDHVIVEAETFKVEAGRQYNFRAERKGKTVRVYIDDDCLVSFEEDAPCGRYTSLAVLEKECAFEEVKITDGKTGEILFYDNFANQFDDDFQFLYAEIQGLSDWMDAKIPGSVQASLLDNRKIEDPFYGYNGPKQTWVDECLWIYKRMFCVPNEKRGKPCRIHFDGVDYRYSVYLNGSKIAEREGMYDFEVQVNDWLREGENELLVVVYPIAHLPGHGVVRPYIFHRWHFNMDVLPIGIWRSVWLDFYDKVYLLDPQVVTKKIQGSSAELELSVTLVNMALWPYDIKARWIITSPCGEEIKVDFTPGFCNGSIRMTENINIPNVKLWWPNGLGEQNLYSIRVEADLLQPSKSPERVGHDEISLKTGIRIVQMISRPRDYVPEYPEKVANTRTNGEWNWCFTVNGKPFFAKGANWMPVDQLYRFDKEKYEILLKQVRESQMNMLRLWGGGPFETEDFYNLCDEYGICVWQELPMSCGYYHNTDLDVWEDTIISNIKRLRNHPSLTTWCGGNEIDPDSPQNMPIIQLASRLFEEFDGTREFRPACPYGGDNHSYVVNWQGGADYSKYRLDYSPAATEYSMSSPMCMSSLKRVMAEEEFDRWPIAFPDNLEKFEYAQWGCSERKESSFSLHDAHLNSVVSKKIAPMSDCGIPKTMEQFVRYMQTAHGLLLQYAADWFRSRWPECTAAFSWCLNAPDPNTLCWSLIDYFGVPKRAYYYQRRAYEKLHIGATSFDISMPIGEEWRAKLFAVNETDETIKNATLRVKLVDSSFRMLKEKTCVCDIAKNQTSRLGYFTYFVSEKTEEITVFFIVELFIGEKILSRSVYCPRIGKRTHKAQFYKEGPHISDVEKMKTLLETSMEQTEQGFKITVVNVGEYPAFEVAIEQAENNSPLILSDNYFWLDKGESKEIYLEGEISEDLNISAWNSEKTTIKGKTKH